MDNVDEYAGRIAALALAERQKAIEEAAAWLETMDTYMAGRPMSGKELGRRLRERFASG